MTALVDGYFASVEETEGWIPGTETLFEDAAVAGGNASLVLDLGDFGGHGGLGDLLAEYVRLTRPFIWILGEQANMRHFFTEHYGSDRVPLLQFYEDYYREHLEGHLERQERFWEKGAAPAASRSPSRTWRWNPIPGALSACGSSTSPQAGRSFPSTWDSATRACAHSFSRCSPE
jgi:hypothetical protein